VGVAWHLLFFFCLLSSTSEHKRMNRESKERYSLDEFLTSEQLCCVDACSFYWVIPHSLGEITIILFPLWVLCTVQLNGYLESLPQNTFSPTSHHLFVCVAGNAMCCVCDVLVPGFLPYHNCYINLITFPSMTTTLLLLPSQWIFSLTWILHSFLGFIQPPLHSKF
jgi:hypothetical protein